MAELTSSTREAAQRLGVSDTTMHKGERTGRITREPDGQWNIAKLRLQMCETADPQRSPLAGSAAAEGILRGSVDLRRTFRDFDRIVRIHRPTDHRRRGVPTAIRAMAEGVGDGVALDRISDCATMAATGNHHFKSLRGSSPFS